MRGRGSRARPWRPSIRSTWRSFSARPTSGSGIATGSRSPGGSRSSRGGGLLTSDAAAIGRRQSSDRRYTLEVFAKGADGGIWIGRHERIGNTATGVLDWSGFTESVGTAVGEGQALFWRELGTGTWLGAVQWAQSDQIYAFWRDTDGATRYAAIAPDRGVLGQARGGTWMDRLAVHAGGSFQADETLVVYTSRHPWLPYRSRATFQRAGWELTEHETVPVAPLVPSTVSALFTLTERMTADDLQERRRQLAAVFRLASATSWPRAIQAYLEEAHYFVPVHLAMQLQRRGHYVPALDWFRTVYDYSVPADRRKIYAGLQREGDPGRRLPAARRLAAGPAEPARRRVDPREHLYALHAHRARAVPARLRRRGVHP
jgi:hypothetical protein